MDFQPHHMLGNFNLLDDEDENFDYQLLHHNGEQWLTFRLGKETYGLDILQVRELISYPDSITRVPRMPSFLLGMINLRGMVLPIMDLRKRFEMSDFETGPFTVIIIVQIKSKVIGFKICQRISKSSWRNGDPTGFGAIAGSRRVGATEYASMKSESASCFLLKFVF